jgi:hypothetical protein
MKSAIREWAQSWRSLGHLALDERVRVISDFVESLHCNHKEYPMIVEARLAASPNGHFPRKPTTILKAHGKFSFSFPIISLD